MKIKSGRIKLWGMRISAANMIMKTWAQQAAGEEPTVSKRIRSINLKTTYTKTKAECIMKPIQRARQEEKKARILPNK